ncbi:MAG: sugar transferase [Victivallaceae bacterium]|nr:sugar transferase [Victivallaceae bacterium]
MKCIINCTQSSTAWITEAFPGLSPYMLSIGNKPYLEYLLDFCTLAGIADVLVASADPGAEWRYALDGAERWSLKISYCKNADDLRGRPLVDAFADFVDGDDTLLFQGIFMPVYDKRDFKMPEYSADGIVAELTPAGDGYMIIGRRAPVGAQTENRFGRMAPPAVERMDSILSFYEINMKLVYGDGVRYNMPGYSSEPNVYIGRNVVIAAASEVTQPVMLGDSLRLERGTRIGPGAVIGNNSLVDTGTDVSDSVVIGNSYIGREMDICGKVIYRKSIFDPASGERLDINDSSMLTLMLQDGNAFISIKQRLIGLMVLLIQVIPFVLLRPFIKLQSENVECYMFQNHTPRCRRLKLYCPDKPAGNMAGCYFRKLSLDVFHLLPLVFCGELRLVGNYLLPVNERNGKILSHLKDYAPGLFSLTQLNEHEKDPDKLEMDEVYYAYHAGFWLNIRLLVRIMVQRLMTQY